MKKDLNKLLDDLADYHEMTKINDKYYQGKYGSIFKKTSFGFEIASVMADDYPEFKGEFFKKTK